MDLSTITLDGQYKFQFCFPGGANNIQALDLLCPPNLDRRPTNLDNLPRPRNLPPSVFFPIRSRNCGGVKHVLTRKIRLLRRKAQTLRQETGDDRWKAPIEKMQRSVAQTVLRSMYRPIMLLAMEPMCLNLCVFSAILLGILYLFFGAFQLVFQDVYGFDLWQRGLCFMGLFVGMVFAILSDPIWRRNYMRLERNYQNETDGQDEFQPEWRLPPGKLTDISVVKLPSNRLIQRSWVGHW